MQFVMGLLKVGQFDTPMSSIDIPMSFNGVRYGDIEGRSV